MSSDAHDPRGSVVVMLVAALAFAIGLCTAWRVSQEPPGPKWEFYGGYSFFHPGADVQACSAGIVSGSSRLESNPEAGRQRHL